MFLFSCVNMKEISIYNYEKEKTEGINGFTSVEIFSKGGTDEVWGHKMKIATHLVFQLLMPV